MNLVRFRPAISSDAGCLSEIALEAKRHWGYPAEWIDRWRPDLTITPYYLQTEKVCVAENADEVIGFAGLSWGDRGRRIEHLWVRPSQLGHGLGRRLFSEVVGLARKEGTTTLLIQSDPHAEGFYLKMGAIRIGFEAYPMPDGTRREIPLLVYRAP